MQKFSDTQHLITKNYKYTPTGFSIGNLYNDKNSNQWSAKVLSYAILNNLNTQETLYLFGEHYQYVLENPSSTSHANIRALIKNGLEKVKFDENKLALKKN